MTKARVGDMVELLDVKGKYSFAPALGVVVRVNAGSVDVVLVDYSAECRYGPRFSKWERVTFNDDDGESLAIWSVPDYEYEVFDDSGDGYISTEGMFKVGDLVYCEDAAYSFSPCIGEVVGITNDRVQVVLVDHSPTNYNCRFNVGFNETKGYPFAWNFPLSSVSLVEDSEWEVPAVNEAGFKAGDFVIGRYFSFDPSYGVVVRVGPRACYVRILAYNCAAVASEESVKRDGGWLYLNGQLTKLRF